MQFLTAYRTVVRHAPAVTVTHERGSTLKINPGGNFETGSGGACHFRLHASHLPAK